METEKIKKIILFSILIFSLFYVFFWNNFLCLVSENYIHSTITGKTNVSYEKFHIHAFNKQSVNQREKRETFCKVTKSQSLRKEKCMGYMVFSMKTEHPKCQNITNT